MFLQFIIPYILIISLLKYKKYGCSSDPVQPRLIQWSPVLNAGELVLLKVRHWSLDPERHTTEVEAG